MQRINITMPKQKQSINEVASSVEAVKLARAEPIQQQAAAPRMEFIRSLILGVPIQVLEERDPEPIVPEINDISTDNDISSIRKLAGL